MLVRALLRAVVFTGVVLAIPAANGGTASSGSAIPELEHGSPLDVTCPNIEQAAADAVRVVLYPGQDAISSGINSVLVTDPTIAPGVVHLRLPDIPDLKDHIVQVKVIYLDASGKHACDAGRIRLL